MQYTWSTICKYAAAINLKNQNFKFFIQWKMHTFNHMNIFYVFSCTEHFQFEKTITEKFWPTICDETFSSIIESEYWTLHFRKVPNYPGLNPPILLGTRSKLSCERWEGPDDVQMSQAIQAQPGLYSVGLWRGTIISCWAGNW